MLKIKKYLSENLKKLSKDVLVQFIIKDLLKHPSDNDIIDYLNSIVNYNHLPNEKYLNFFNQFREEIKEEIKNQIIEPPLRNLIDYLFTKENILDNQIKIYLGSFIYRKKLITHVIDKLKGYVAGSWHED